MKLLPQNKYEFTTALSAEQTLRRFADAIEPKQYLRIFSRTKPFEGEVIGQDLEFSPVLLYRNSFRPFIRASVYNRDNGARVRISMGLLPSVLVFLALLCYAPLLVILGVAIASFQTGQWPPPQALLVCIVPIVGFLVAHGAFRLEASATHAKIQALFDDAGYTETNVRHSTPEGIA